MASVVSLGGFGPSRSIALGSVRSGLFLICLEGAVMPATRRRLTYLSPIIVMRHRRSFLPLDRLIGVSPSQAANSRPLRNCCLSPAVATMAKAMAEPIQEGHSRSVWRSMWLTFILIRGRGFFGASQCRSKRICPIFRMRWPMNCNMQIPHLNRVLH